MSVPSVQISPPPTTSLQPKVPSAAGLLSMLSEPEAALRRAALSRLFNIVDTQWHEVAQALPDLEALAEDTEEDVATRQLAASVASRVFFYLEEPSQALRLALESGDGVFDISSSSSSVTGATSSGKAYVECLVGAAVDAYVTKKKSEHQHEETKTKEDDVVGALPMDKLHNVVQAMLEKCYREDNFEHALGIALEARETEKVTEIFHQCWAHSNENFGKMFKLLQFAYDSSTTVVDSKAFRFQVMQVITIHLTKIMSDENCPTTIQKECACSLVNTQQVLRNAKPAAKMIADLLHGTDDDALLAYQICFDLIESGDKVFMIDVAESLENENHEDDESKSDSDDGVHLHFDRYSKAYSILTGGFTTELAISFLHKNSDSDPLIMENLKQALEQRGAGRNSMLHNCAVLTHSYLNAGTTNDSFLRDNLEWMKKASNW